MVQHIVKIVGFFDTNGGIGYERLFVHVRTHVYVRVSTYLVRVLLQSVELLAAVPSGSIPYRIGDRDRKRERHMSRDREMEFTKTTVMTE